MLYETLNRPEPLAQALQLAARNSLTWRGIVLPFDMDIQSAVTGTPSKTQVFFVGSPAGSRGPSRPEPYEAAARVRVAPSYGGSGRGSVAWLVAGEEGGWRL